MSGSTTLSSVSGLPSLVQRLQVDRVSSEPCWRQIKRRISEMILAGELPPGANLPSERDLAQALGLSRATVKRGYDDLRQSAQLSTHGRGGTVVQAPPRVDGSMGRLKGFTDEMRELGRVPSTRVVEHGVRVDRTLASIFSRPSHAEFLYLVRVRSGDGIPMTREVAWYDLTVAPAMADWDGQGSAYAYLREHCGLVLSWADQTVEAVASSPVESAVFGFDEPAPCLLLKRRTFCSDRQLVEYVEGCFRGDAYSYRVRLEV